jgi:hypothetical protein
LGFDQAKQRLAQVRGPEAFSLSIDPLPGAFDDRFSRGSSDLFAVTIGVVFVGFAVLFAGDFFVGAVAERLVLRQAAHADPRGFLLGFDLERLVIGFKDFSHGYEINLQALAKQERSSPLRLSATCAGERFGKRSLFRLFDLCESDRLFAVLFRDDPFRDDLRIFLTDLVVKVFRYLIVVGQDDLLLAARVPDLDRHLTGCGLLQFTFRANGFAGDFGVPRIQRQLERSEEGETERYDGFHLGVWG